MKTRRSSGGQAARIILSLSVLGIEKELIRSGHLSPEERYVSTHRIWHRVCLKLGLDLMIKKITRAVLETEHQSFHRLDHRGLCVNKHTTGYLSDYI